MLETVFSFLQETFTFEGAKGLFRFGIIDGEFLVFTVMFLGVLIAFEGISQLLAVGENREEARNRRMRMLARGKTAEEALQILRPPATSGPLGRLPFVGDLPASLRAAGIMLPPGLFLAGCVAAFVLMAALGAQIYAPAISASIAFAAFIVAPLATLGYMEKRRRARFVKQLPDALDLMARGLRVGHPLNASLQSVADEMADPVGTEFGIVIDQITYGDELTTAIRDLSDRIDEEDMRYLSIAVTMQHGTGGDLADVLDTLARVIRSRMALRRKVRAISSEGRLTAYILSALPFIIAGFMTYNTPSYYGEVMDYPYFWHIMAAIFGAVILNAIILFRLVNFRI